ncbi:glucokinase [Aminobacter aminovorans]|uniref:N-acetylmannosamine kinase n=1 Tax=Aminobacter aminovorans TaxID=83263 RepID=A0A380WM60_AMIAI|nr:ROK family protein [Aminobacter aminovorans]TCS27763.1 glucokinase [Aminobacter aminovorans]SUU89825.1 N-acetylmannosamine kinase [Aminobacter aminovorans]
MSKVLAIDLGGTQLRAGICDDAAPAAVRHIGAWPAPKGLDGLCETIAWLAKEHSAERLGVSVPGTARGARCLWIPNLPWLDGVDLSGQFPDLVIGLGQDAQLALLAEASAGAAKTLSDAILVAIGTGIGSAVLSGSRIVRGGHGAACSFGWACADLDDDGDDRDGWLERQAAGRAFDAIGRQAGFSDGRGVVAAARAGNTDAIDALARPAKALGVSLATAVALLDPQSVILAGGVAEAADVLVPMVQAAMKKQLPPHLRCVRIEAGSFGKDASLVGAAFAGVRGQQWDEIR